MKNDNNVNILNIVTDLVQDALDAGAESAEVIGVTGADLSIDVRHGEIENSGFSEAKSLGIRVFVGKQSSIVSSSDFSQDALKEMIDRAIANARIVPEDPYAGLVPEQDLFKNYKLIPNINDFSTPDLSELKERALIAEKTALSMDGITNSEGAGCSFGRYHVYLANSHGFSGSFEKTLSGLSCSVIAGSGTNMQRDYDYSTTCLFDKLENPEIIGQKAAQRTIKKVNPVQMKSGQFPVVFDKRIGRSLLGAFSSAISADKISRGVSFLGNMVNQKVFADGITIIDNPHMAGGLASVPFDGEGTYNPELTVIDNGILKELLSSSVSARKMNIKNNGRGQRSVGSNAYPGGTNMYIQAGMITPEALYGDIQYGLYVTETIGHGLNDITGDYSIGVSGFLIENGELTSVPINEVTMAGNLKDAFLSIRAANDLVFESRKNVPTLRVDSFTIAGK